MAPKVIKGGQGIIICASLALLVCGSRAASAYDKKLSLSLSHFIVASMYAQRGDIASSVAEYENALRLDFKNPFLHLNLALSYLKGNQIPKAIGELNYAIQFDPEAVEPHALLALIYFSQSKTQEGTAEYETALKNASKLEPTNIDIYKSLGAVYVRQKKFQDAKKIFDLILDLAPADSEAHFLLATIYDAQLQRQGAIDELRKAIELKPDYHEALNYLGYVYVEENKYLDKAEAMIRKALTLEPNNGAYLDSLGWLYYKQGKTKEALKELQQASDLLDDPVIFDHLGEVYLKLNEKENAKANWEKSLSLSPAQEKVKEKLEKLKKETATEAKVK